MSKKRTLEYADYFTVLCGRRTGDSFDCGGVLGRIWLYSARKGSDLSDPDNWTGARPNFTDWTSVALPALLELVTDWSHVHLEETPDGKRVQIWLAEHELGYCRLPNGDYQVLPRRSPLRESERLRRTKDPADRTRRGIIERPEGRRPLPQDHADLLRFRGGVRDGTPLGLGPGGRGTVGAIPTLPVVITCPKCSPVPRRDDRCRQVTRGATRNLVQPL